MTDDEFWDEAFLVALENSLSRPWLKDGKPVECAGTRVEVAAVIADKALIARTSRYKETGK